MPRPRRAAPGASACACPPPEVDWAGVRAHVHGAIARIAPNDSAARFRGMGVEVVEASAHFLGPDAIEAGGRRLGFRRCVVAAGSAAVVPDLPGLDGVPWLTNETIFDLEEPPGHLLILGGGPIGLEMAQAHARLGCRVTVLEAAPRIAAREDEELVEGLRPFLRADGVEIREGARVSRLERPGDGTRGVVAVLEDGAPRGGHAPAAGDRPGAAPVRPRPAGGQRRGGSRAASPRGGTCAPCPTAGSGRWATSPTRRGSGRAPSPMWRASTPASSCAPCCSACPARGSTTTPCRA